MASIADRVYEIVNALPEAKAAQILDFAESVKARNGVHDGDFFSFAGLWAGREIAQDSL